MGVKVAEQIGRYLIWATGRGLFLNNADWLMGLSYINFLRDIGPAFFF